MGAFAFLEIDGSLFITGTEWGDDAMDRFGRVLVEGEDFLSIKQNDWGDLEGDYVDPTGDTTMAVLNSSLWVSSDNNLYFADIIRPDTFSVE